jgi:transcriptional regulator with XRE-family HTH domain
MTINSNINSKESFILLGLKIKSLRLQKGLTQKTLSRICGLNYNYIGLIERGEKNVSLLALCNLSKALDIPLSEIALDL